MALTAHAPTTVGRYLEPVINGHRYSYASIEIILNGILMVGVRRISYGSGMEGGSLYGSDAQRVGRTPGEAKHRAEIELYRREWTVLMESLGPSFGRTPFAIGVQYAEEGDEGVTNDVLWGCRITDVDLSNDDGTDAAVVRLTLDPMDIRLGHHGLSIEAMDLQAFAVNWQADNAPEVAA